MDREQGLRKLSSRVPSLGGGSRAWSQPGAHAAAVEGLRWGGAPGGADLRLGPISMMHQLAFCIPALFVNKYAQYLSVREALAREVLLRNFAPTPRPAP